MADPGKGKRKTEVSRRQEQKRLRTDVDKIFRKVDVNSEDWLGQESRDSAVGRVPDSIKGVADQSSPQFADLNSNCDFLVGPASPPSSLKSTGVSEVVTEGPTRLSELLSDYESSSSSSGDEYDLSDFDLQERLNQWYLKSRVNLQQLDLLLKELHPFHPSLALHARTVAHTPRATEVKKLDNGQYVHLGLRNALLSRLRKSGTKTDSNILHVEVNVDGLASVSKSSSVDVWPIQGRCRDLFQDKPFPIGIFCGTSKPQPLEGYLEDYIAGVISLLNDG